VVAGCGLLLDAAADVVWARVAMACSPTERVVVRPGDGAGNTSLGRYGDITGNLLSARGDIVYITGMAVDPEKTVRKLVSLPIPMVQAIADFRFQQRISTESEAIRRLIEAGLDRESRRVQET
jgi:hypothetical protein